MKVFAQPWLVVLEEQLFEVFSHHPVCPKVGFELLVFNFDAVNLVPSFKLEFQVVRSLLSLVCSEFFFLESSDHFKKNEQVIVTTGCHRLLALNSSINFPNANPVAQNQGHPVDYNAFYNCEPHHRKCSKVSEHVVPLCK